MKKNFIKLSTLLALGVSAVSIANAATVTTSTSVVNPNTGLTNTKVVTNKVTSQQAVPGMIVQQPAAPIITQSPAPTVVSSGNNGSSALSGFYIKADVGAAIPLGLTEKGKIENIFDSNAFDFYNAKSPKTSVIFGGGLGYKFNENFRADLSVSYLNKSKFDANTYAKAVADGKLVIINNKTTQEFSSLLAMVNGYYDAGKIMDVVSPFFNVGVGYARVKAGELKISQVGYDQTTTIPSRNNSNFAWSVGGGLSFAVNPNLYVDVAYKYLDMGKAQSGDQRATKTAMGTESKKLADNQLIKPKFRAHVVTAGLRYVF